MVLEFSTFNINRSRFIESRGIPMPSSGEWAILFDEVEHVRSTIPTANTYIRAWDSACRAVQVGCDDGNDYVIKGSQAGRSVFNDQVVGRIGTALGAPIGEVGFVTIPEELIRINPDMSHVNPGLAHSSLFVADCSECLWFQHCDVLENRSRFAALSLLFGWVVIAERQFFYSNSKPQIVYSFDHDNAFPGGPNWTVEQLDRAPYADLDDVFVQNCRLNNEEIMATYTHMRNITPRVIAQAIGSVPVEWGDVLQNERLELANYLFSRCQTFLE